MQRHAQAGGGRDNLHALTRRIVRTTGASGWAERFTIWAKKKATRSRRTCFFKGRLNMKSAMKIVCLVIAFSIVANSQGVCRRFRPVAGRCDLSASPAEQAKCLLRPVKKFANLGAPLSALPAPLDTLLAQPTESLLTIEQVRSFLARKGIPQEKVGGSLSVSLSRPKYFVIHDTSDFLDGATAFPANIDQATAGLNNLGRRVETICHIYVNRVGDSKTVITFESTAPPNGTKFSACHPSQKSAFLHIENIQPRIRDRSVGFPNDGIAPDPGFSDAQLERLALLYLVASTRSGKWLIPAYHSPIDLGFPNQHDDPQNFNLNKWAEILNGLIEQIRSGS